MYPQQNIPGGQPGPGNPPMGPNVPAGPGGFHGGPGFPGGPGGPGRSGRSGRSKRVAIFAGGLAAGVVVAALGGWFVTAGGDDSGSDKGKVSAESGEKERKKREKKNEDGPPPAVPPAKLPPGPERVECPSATVTVKDAGSLSDALAKAEPGTSIKLENGTYSGKFVATKSGTKDKPIFFCGDAGAVLDGGGIKKGYGFHLSKASHWRLVGFTVRNSQKGVIADGTQHSVIQDLTVDTIGDEAIHLRTHSTDNLVTGNTIRNTGKRREKFGEGVYIGSAVSNWGRHTDGKPDKSDRNTVRENKISAVTAEGIDVKEGTSGGAVVGNTFDGSGMHEKGADSWVDIKGNGWLIEGNAGSKSLLDGFQTHEIEKGWGTGNVFKNNRGDLRNNEGLGIHLTPKPEGNKVTCDNKISGGKGLTNGKCE